MFVDYAIPGTPATLTQCSFTYRSSVGHKSGPFNSPRHPSNYPHNTDCNYEFIGLSNEQVRITFENFHVENGGAEYVFVLIRSTLARLHRWFRRSAVNVGL